MANIRLIQTEAIPKQRKKQNTALFTSVVGPINLNISPAEFTLVGENVSLRVQRSLSIGSVTYTITGEVVTFQVQRQLNIGHTTYTINGQNVNLVPGAFILSVAPAEFTLVGETVGLAVSRVLNISPAEFLFTGMNVDINTSTADTYEDYAAGSLGYVFGSQFDMSSGLYTEFAGTYLPQSIGLNSSIEVGLIHMQKEEYDDELAMITNMMLGIDLQPYTLEDYQTENDFGVDIIEDYLLETGNVDYGTLITLDTTFDVLITAYIDDGKTIFNQEIPTLQLSNAGSLFYTATTNGMYHSVALTANEPGQTFHLKLLDTSGIYTGRL